MASGLSGRAKSDANGFDFATDDILCSYEDYGNQDSANRSHSDSGVATNSGKALTVCREQDFQKSRLTRPTMYSSPSYSQPDDSLNQDIIAIVDKSMKKHVDGIMRFLEGISSRLSQLELYCYNLDKSIGEMRLDLTRDHGDSDTKLKSLDKHIQEVHRSVQILRDKQELADTQKELAKLQLAQKETSSVNSQNSDDKSSAPASESKKLDSGPDAPNNRLALALPHQVSQQQQASPAPPQNVPQQHTYYLQTPQIPNSSGPTQIPQMQYVSADPQGRIPPQTAQPQGTHTQNIPQYPQYQQQWSQQQVQVQLPPQMRNQATPGYPPYPATNPPPHETIPSSIQMQVPYSGVPAPVLSRADTVPYGYGGPTRVLQQQPPSQPQRGAFGPPPGEGYAAPGGPQSALRQGSGYMVYEPEGGRAHHPLQQQPHFSQGGYPPNIPFQNPQSNLMSRNSSHPQFSRNHPYGELIEKLVNMGFRDDHVASVIQRMEESGQQVDFNSVLDRLNGHPSSSQRGWSG